MKNSIKTLPIIALLMLGLTACTSGPVQDKRAPGMPGEKTYEVLVNGSWQQVTSAEWDRCDLDDPYPACRTEKSSAQP